VRLAALPVVPSCVAGVPMGTDVCDTNHAEAEADDTDTLLTLMDVAGCSFVICALGGEDVMVHHQSLFFRDAL
jgi:ethanolamine ammonia-lyase large subunit